MPPFLARLAAAAGTVLGLAAPVVLAAASSAVVSVSTSSAVVSLSAPSAVASRSISSADSGSGGNGEPCALESCGGRRLDTK